MKKLLVLTLLLMLIGMSGYAMLMRIQVNGNDHLLKLIQDIRPGMSKEDVRTILGGELLVIPASPLPGWMETVVAEREDGEFCYHPVGYPSRVIIIRFNGKGAVEFVTWKET